jgi:hypothetical protein
MCTTKIAYIVPGTFHFDLDLSADPGQGLQNFIYLTLYMTGGTYCWYIYDCNIVSLNLHQAYAIEAREEWVKDWPGQVVLCVSQIYWTVECHDFINDGPPGLQKYWDRLQEQLTTVVALVRGKLNKQQRITLGALVTIDVHARDVIMEMKEKGKCVSILNE